MRERNGNTAHTAFRAERYRIVGAPAAQKAERRDFYKLWLLENEGTLHYGDSTDEIRKPSLVFMHPLTLYSFTSPVPSRSGYWAVFDVDFLLNGQLSPSLIFRPNQATVIHLTRETYRRCSLLFQGIVDDHHSAYPNRYDSIRNALFLLMHEGLKYLPDAAHKTINEPASKRLSSQFLDLLEKQFPLTSPQEPMRLRRPADFAGQLAVHVNHLNAAVRQVTGKPTSAHIAERLVRESKALLQFTDWPVAEIAYALGFDYPNHFTAFFKKHTSKTPLELRKMIL